MKKYTRAQVSQRKFIHPGDTNYAPRPGAIPLGTVGKLGQLVFNAIDVSVLKGEDSWRRDGKRIKVGEVPVDFLLGCGRFGDWQVEER